MAGATAISSTSNPPPKCDIIVYVRFGRVHSTAVSILPASPQQLWGLLACKGERCCW